MDTSQKILSEITVFNKYARYIPEIERRETWQELCERNMAMHIRKYPVLKEEIKEVYKNFVIPKKVLPSMRSLQFGGNSIELSNNRMYNCFSRDTSFITSKGTKSFNDFISGDEITVKTHLGNWKAAAVKSYGVQSLNEIEFVRGRSTKKIKATANHRWILSDGSETSNLTSGDVIYFAPGAENFDYFESNPLERLYWCYGYIFGDGTKCQDKNGNYKYSAVRLCGNDKNKYKDRFEEMGLSSSSPHSCGGDPIFYTGTYLKPPVDLTTEDKNMIHAFMDGYLCADAEKNPNWYKDERNSRYISIQSSDLDHIALLRTGLEMFGYYIINEGDLSNEVTNFGPRKEGTTKFRLLNGVGETNNSKWAVKEITENVSTEDVWCLEVEDDHSFILSGGIVTGNCAYMPVDHPDAFSETMFLLLGGTGVGYSVQSHHVAKLPIISGPKDKTRRFLIGDSIEGWADAIKILVEASFYNKAEPVFDYRDIRPKGARLITSGGKAPGPAPLRICIEQVRSILMNAKGRKITPIEAHDIQCHIADAVLSGGIRRAAMISLFSKDDMDMLSCKSGVWWELNPQRGRANNSIVLDRNIITDEEFFDVWERVEESGAGEPGIFWTNDDNLGTNPCCVTGDTLVQVSFDGLSKQTMRTKDVVELIKEGKQVDIFTFDGEKHTMKPIVEAAMTRKAAELMRITDTDTGKQLICTPDHRIFTENRGYIRADELQADDKLKIASLDKTSFYVPDFVAVINDKTFTIEVKGSYYRQDKEYYTKNKIGAGIEYCKSKG